MTSNMEKSKLTDAELKEQRNIYIIAGVIGVLGVAIILYKTRKK